MSTLPRTEVSEKNGMGVRRGKVMSTSKGLPAAPLLAPDCAELAGGSRDEWQLESSPTTGGVTAQVSREVRSQPPMVGHDIIASGKQALDMSWLPLPWPPRGPLQLLLPLGPRLLTTGSPPLRGPVSG